MRKTYKQLVRYAYLLKKIVQFSNKTVVVYNKRHPIFTNAFEDTPNGRYIYVYIHDIDKTNFLEKYILRKCTIIHSDCARFTFKTTDFKNKLILAECEAQPKDFLYSDDLVPVIYMESKFAMSFSDATNPKIALLYPGVTIHTKNNYDASKKKITLTAIGYGGMLKGFDVVYKIYKTLKATMQIQLVIAGNFGHNYHIYPEITHEAYDAANFPAIQEELQKDPDVIMGPKKQSELMTSIYPNTDIYLHISRMDTFGFSVLEALSFGIPVIVTNLKALPEMVEDGVNGFVINDFTDDINSREWFDKSYNEGLAAIKKLIADPQLRQRMGDKSYERAQQIFDAKQRKQIIEDEYDRLLQGQK